jgi:serine/threonine protein phosphatase PrpC
MVYNRFASMRTVSAGATHVGQKREHNEDYYVCDDRLGLYVVADGVGGHAKGEVASRAAVEEVVMWVRRHRPEIDARLASGAVDDIYAVRRLVESGVQSACYMVYAMAEQDPEKAGMSTTMSTLLLRHGRAFIAQVGDSRVYRVRDGELLQITEDHTLVNYRLKQGLITAEEAKVSSAKNVITRAVGHRDYVQVDTFDADALAGDRYFLCTDGFHGYTPPEKDVLEIVSTPMIERGVANAIDLANQLGGRDNVTAVLVKVM